MHAAKLRVELSQSRREQHEYLKNVELARVLNKRAERKRKPEDDEPGSQSGLAIIGQKKIVKETEAKAAKRMRKAKEKPDGKNDHPQLRDVLDSIF